jgi:FAD/FMN-containing dehydrogenase
MLSASAIDHFRRAFRGRLLVPSDDPAYDHARRVFNATIDRRPALIAQCGDSADVVACVTFARERELPLSVRGGGHSIAGKAVCDGGLMIDLSTMKGIRVEPAARTTRAEPGLTLGEFDRATHPFGLATTLGVVSNTGIAGLTLGGGIGWLNGKYGLACDNAIAFDVVAADATVLRATAAEHEDLYWGLRGGSGNLAIVTAIQYRLHPVETVLAGAVFHPLDRAAEALRFFVEFSAGAPDELTTMAALVTLPDGAPAAALSVCYCGSPADGERVVTPLRSFGSPLADRIERMPYVAAQSMLDGFFPANHHHYWKSNLTSRVPYEAIDAMVDYMARKPSPFTIAGLQALHGAAGRVPGGDTAFPHRGDRFDCMILSQWADAADGDRNIAWTKEFYAAIQPHVDAAVYVNNLGDEPDAVVRAAFGANYQRLAAVKARYDPTNVFRSTQNVRPNPDATTAAHT